MTAGASSGAENVFLYNSAPDADRVASSRASLAAFRSVQPFFPADRPTDRSIADCEHWRSRERGKNKD